ncbi:MAG: peptidase S8 [Cyanothece sp. SIO1E1]|nr:peptidase S8 [Cyanothece sp. SIO1E1]
MKKLLLIGLFLLSLVWVLTNFTGLANQGTFETVLLDFKDDLTAAQIESQLQPLSGRPDHQVRLNSEFSEAENLYILTGDRHLLSRLRRSELAQQTELIEPNYVYSVADVPNDPDYAKQWNLRSIGVESAWDETQGDGVTVAVIDTGISPVPDLNETKFVAGYDFVNDRVEAEDDNGHGTHVAGTIAQSTNNKFGVAGIAHAAKLMPLKVLSATGGGTVADIAEAIRFAADNGADVVNLSLGGSGESQFLKAAIDYAHRQGVVLIAAAGNENRNSASYPARYPNVMAVAALDAAADKAPYSNFGAGVDISAPGGSLQGDAQAGGILQNTIDPESGNSIFAAFQGTSMASPHVAGVAALIKAVGVEEPDQVVSILKQSARPVEDDALNHFGAGQLDAAKAVQLALRGQITFRDFFRWLQDNGYLNLRFWFDGGAVALLPKIGMVLGSYLLAWFLRNYLPFAWSWPFSGGLVAGSAGLFFLRGCYIFDLPQWPFRVMGSSIPELGGAIQGSALLNPLFASVLIPLGLIALFLSHPQWKWFAIGSSLGVATCLFMSAMTSPAMMWLGTGAIARLFLLVNALLCYGLAYLAMKAEVKAV